MAKTKRTAAKNVKAEIGCPAISDYKPSLYLDLEGKDVKELGDLKPGEEVQVMVIGTVKRVSQEKRMKWMGDGKSEKEVTSGQITIDDYKVVVVEDEKNEFIKMANSDNEE